MSRQITPEMIAAWRTLQLAAAGHYRLQPQVRKAINDLDNSDFMVPIQETEELENTAPRTPVVIEHNGPLFQARGADGRIWSTATTYALVEEHLREQDTLFIVCGPEELGIPPLDLAEWGDTTREDMARRHGLEASDVNWDATRSHDS